MTSERAARRAFVLLAVLAGCADFSRGPTPAGVDAGAGEGGVGDAAVGEGGVSPDAAASFAADVHGILSAACQSCHTDGGEAGDTTFLLTGDAAADLAVTTDFVDVNAPASSRLLAKMSGSGHGGGTLYAVGTTEYETVLRWIQEGARP